MLRGGHHPSGQVIWRCKGERACGTGQWRHCRVLRVGGACSGLVARDDGGMAPQLGRASQSGRYGEPQAAGFVVREGPTGNLWSSPWLICAVAFAPSMECADVSMSVLRAQASLHALCPSALPPENAQVSCARSAYKLALSLLPEQLPCNVALIQARPEPNPDTDKQSVCTLRRYHSDSLRQTPRSRRCRTVVQKSVITLISGA